MIRALVNLLTPEQQWGAQILCCALLGWALGKLTVEVGRGGIAAVTRRIRGGTR